MAWYHDLKVRVTGVPIFKTENGKTVLTGHYPNPEAGMRIFAVFYWLGLAAFIILPAIAYGPNDEADGSLSAALDVIWRGMPEAIGQLVYLVPAWRGDVPASELVGWGYGLGFAFVIFLFGSGVSRLWATFTDRPYLRIEADADTLSVQRGMLGEPVLLPRREISGVHVGRRGRKTYDVLIQRGGDLVPVTIVGGRESRALTLKAKIDALLASEI